VLLKQEQLLSAPVYVSADIVPGVGGVVIVSIGPSVCQVDFAGLWSYISEGVENVSKFLVWKISRVKVTTIDGLYPSSVK
jgi:hypothetical protein